MYRFPEGLYSDVRIEEVFKSDIALTMGRLDNMKEQRYRAAFLRVFDGSRWYYSATTDVSAIESELSRLADLADPSGDTLRNEVLEKFEVNTGTFLKFQERDLSLETLETKLELLENYSSAARENELIKFWKAQYTDQKTVKRFYSSKGAELTFDYQKAGFRLSYQMVNGQEQFGDRFDTAANDFDSLRGLESELRERVGTSEHFIRNCRPVEPGKYTVVLSPEAAGIFAHESFGHKSEADFMLKDETMLREWKLGKKVGSDILSIIDDGNIPGVGYTAFDDEGTKARETYLIKDGYLSGRLHSVETAAALNERPTGNARAVSFEYEPIVRMTTTYIAPGKLTFEELLSGVKKGVYVHTLNHGSGMSTFTLAPGQAFMIRDGQVAEPVKISVVTGNVFQTLGEIEGVSEKVELSSFALGGCGKMEQFPLSVGFGGPFVRVGSLNVQ